MNANEFESWLKQQMEQQQYAPPAGQWDKLHADLKKPSENRRMLAFPVLKIAATVALVSGGVITAVLIRSGNNKAPDATVVHSAKIIAKQAIEQTVPESTQTLPVKDNSFVADHHPQPEPETLAAGTTNVPETQSYQEEANTQPLVITQDGVQKGNEKQDKEQVKEKNYFNNFADIKIKAPRQAAASDQAFGIAANIGRSSLGNVNYQVGFVTRRNISEKLYAEASVNLSCNAVAYDKQYALSTSNAGISGISSSSFENNTEEVAALYANNIYSVGVNPAIGYHIHKQVSVSAGMTVNRNINADLNLDSKNEALSLGSAPDIDKSIKVNQWDWGVTGTMEYNINKQLTFSASYKKGFNYYLQENNNFYRNSGFSLGLKYLLR